MAEEKKYCYDYQRPSVTTDAVVIKNETEILLIQRNNEPFQDAWALPGGFVDEYELPANACARELEEETGLQVSASDLILLNVFGEKGRDPRGWTISVAYQITLKLEQQAVKAGSDSKNVAWFALENLPELAFDHQKIIEEAIGKLM